MLCKWDLSQHTIQSVNPVKARDFLFTIIRPDWPWVSPNLLQGVSGPLPGVNQPGHGADHNHPSAKVRSRAIYLHLFGTFMTGYRRNLLSPQHYYKQSNFSLHLQTKNHEQNSKILLAHIHRVLYMVDGWCAFPCACTLGKNIHVDQ